MTSSFFSSGAGARRYLKKSNNPINIDPCFLYILNKQACFEVFFEPGRIFDIKYAYSFMSSAESCSVEPLILSTDVNMITYRLW